MADLLTGSLSAHLQTQHRISMGAKWETPPLPSIVTPKLSCIIPVVNGTSGMSGGGLPGMGSDPDEA